MSLRGAVSDEIAGASSGVGRVVGSAFAAGEQGAERGTGGGVLDDSSAGARGKKLFGEAKHGHEPIEDVGFEFGGGGAVAAELVGGHVGGFFVSHGCGPLFERVVEQVLERVVEQGYRS